MIGNCAFKRKREQNSLVDLVALLFLDVQKSQAVLKMNLFYFLDTLPISVRLYNCIKNNMTPDSTVSDLIVMGKSKIRSFANIGNRTLAELEQLLTEHDLTLNN
jgi:DNA-directed RNA polymerase alpha subunit